ncbi:cupin domain-containing protein [Flavitalea flava]
MRPTADYWIDKLALTQHIEGGAFREVYRSTVTIPKGSLPAVFKGERNISTSIYFLLGKGQFSAFHRIASDEGWHFYYGDPLLIFEIKQDGTLAIHRLGSDIEKGEQFQTMIRAGSWFASVPAEGSEYALVGCTVAPGFDFADFELAERDSLNRQFPQHAALITKLTKG